MSDVSSIRIRKMTVGDIALGMRLKALAGWNQVHADWEAYLSLESDGCFVAEFDQRAVGTTTTIHYPPPLGWIGMVLVDPPARRRGIATRLVEQAITYLESVGAICQKLDASDAGARVYEAMGFTVEYEVQRWIGRGKGSTRAAAVSPALRPMTAADGDHVVPVDTTAFGASRAKLLRWYCENDSCRFIFGDPDQPAGYVAGRSGSNARQLGPLVAEDAATAESLIHAFLHHLPEEPVIADVITRNREAVRLLEQFGFTRQRVLQRMFRGPNVAPGLPQRTFLLAGFEFG